MVWSKRTNFSIYLISSTWKVPRWETTCSPDWHYSIQVVWTSTNRYFKMFDNTCMEKKKYFIVNEWYGTLRSTKPISSINLMVLAAINIIFHWTLIWRCCLGRHFYTYLKHEIFWTWIRQIHVFAEPNRRESLKAVWRS